MRGRAVEGQGAGQGPEPAVQHPPPQATLRLNSSSSSSSPHLRPHNRKPRLGQSGYRSAGPPGHHSRRRCRPAGRAGGLPTSPADPLPPPLPPAAPPRRASPRGAAPRPAARGPASGPRWWPARRGSAAPRPPSHAARRRSAKGHWGCQKEFPTEILRCQYQPAAAWPPTARPQRPPPDPRRIPADVERSMHSARACASA